MAGRDLTERVEVLEMKTASLEGVPARVAGVESQIVQLRDELRSEFSAMRQETGELGTALSQEMRTLNDETKTQMRVLHEELIDRIAKLGEDRRRRPKGGG